MAEHLTHIADCRKLLGDAYGGVHLYLDKSANPKTMEHRSKTHNWDGVLKVAEMFDAKSGIAAIIHIFRDITGVCPTMEEVEKVFMYHEFPGEIEVEEYKPQGA
jgi:hypothetical protein